MKTLRIFKDKLTAHLVVAFTDEGDVITIPASYGEMVNLSVESVTGMWTEQEFNERFYPVKK